MARKESIRTLRRGVFECPECRTETDYDLQEVVVRTTFLGIPFGSAEPFRRVLCRRCDTLFPESVLQANRPSKPAPPINESPAVPLAPIVVRGISSNGHRNGHHPATAAVPTGNYSFGDRVLARWDYFWYPGVIGARDARGIKVTFDDGDEGVFPPHLVMPFDLREGDRVFARWKGGANYTPGRITRMSDDNITIRYDDGRTEETNVRVVRVIRGHEDNPWRVGDRVFAFWPPSQFLFFPATISGIQEEVLLQIAYDDGDQGVCTPDQVMPIQLQPGDLIFVRTRTSGMQPGDLEEVQGNTLLVHVWETGRTEKAKLGTIATMPANFAAEFRKAQRR